MFREVAKMWTSMHVGRLLNFHVDFYTCGEIIEFSCWIIVTSNKCFQILCVCGGESLIAFKAISLNSPLESVKIHLAVGDASVLRKLNRNGGSYL